MSNKLFKSFFAFAMVLGAALGFVACTEQEEGTSGDPQVELSQSTANFSSAEGSQTVSVKANCKWTVEVDGADWVTITPMTGNNNGTFTVAVAENTTGAVRSVEAKVYAWHVVYGKFGSVKLTISQSADENVTVDEELLYSDDFDGETATKEYGSSNSSWPYIDQFPQFANAKGSAAANVTYTGNKISVRANQPSNTDAQSTYAGSGNNNIFFGDGGYFVVNNISPLKADCANYKITFGLQKYGQSADNSLNTTDFLLYLSKDGENWAPINYTFPANAVEGKYNVVTADFTLAAVPEALYIKFVAKVASVFRIDDLKFFAGNGGQNVDLDNIEAPAPAEKVTIAEVLALGNGATINGAIEGIVVSNYELNNLTSKKGMYVQDETGALQFYLGGDHTFAFGTKVQIDLTGAKLGEYNGAVQVSGLALDKITAISTGNTVTPKVVTMDDFLANKYEGQYISIEGVQVVADDLAKTWSTTDSHTSIYMQNAEGKQFVVFSSKYATYGAETVAQGAGTISGISSISKGVMQIIFAQASDYAGLTGERFDAAAAPEPDPTPDPEPTEAVKVTIAEFLAAAEDSTIYELTGVITSVANTTYGNFYMEDETDSVYIYGLCSPSGEKQYWAASGVKVGDTITVQTVRTSYQGTAQGKDAIYISHVACEVEEEVIPEGCTEATIIFANAGFANEASVDGQTITVDENVSLVFSKGGANNAPAYYDNGYAIRMYQNGALLDVDANGKTIKSIELTFANNHYYLDADSGSLSEEAAVRTWTGEATSVRFTATGTDKNHRAYVSAISVIYEN